MLPNTAQICRDYLRLLTIDPSSQLRQLAIEREGQEIRLSLDFTLGKSRLVGVDYYIDMAGWEPQREFVDRIEALVVGATEALREAFSRAVINAAEAVEFARFHHDQPVG